MAVDCLILTIGIRQGLTSLSVTPKRGSASDLTRGQPIDVLYGELNPSLDDRA